MYHSDAKFNRFGGLNKKHNVVQFKIRDKTSSPSIIGITAKADPSTSCSSSSNSSVDPFEFPPVKPIKKIAPSEEEDNIFDFPDTQQETLEVKLMVASMRAIPQNNKKPKKKVSPVNTPKSLSSTTNTPKSNTTPRIETTRKPVTKVAALKKKIQPPLSNQTNGQHTENNIMQMNNTVMLNQLNQQQQWYPQQSIQLQQQLMQHKSIQQQQWYPQQSLQLQQQLMQQQQWYPQQSLQLQQQLIQQQLREQLMLQQQREQWMLQQQREQLVLQQHIEQVKLKQKREQAMIQQRERAILQHQREQQERQQLVIQQQQLLKERQESSFDIFDFDYNPKVTIKHNSIHSYGAGPSYTPPLIPPQDKVPEKKRKRNVVAHLKTARGETTQAVCFDFLSDEEESTSDLLPLREIKERSKSPELTYAQRMELELEAMTQQVVIPASESKRVEYKPQNKMNVKITFSKK